MKDELIALADRLNEMAINTGTIQMWRVRMGYKANAPAHRERKENVQ